MYFTKLNNKFVCQTKLKIFQYQSSGWASLLTFNDHNLFCWYLALKASWLFVTSTHDVLLRNVNRWSTSCLWDTEPTPLFLQASLHAVSSSLSILVVLFRRKAVFAAFARFTSTLSYRKQLQNPPKLFHTSPSFSVAV